jgi:hypothetical protein
MGIVKAKANLYREKNKKKREVFLSLSLLTITMIKKIFQKYKSAKLTLTLSLLRL